MWRGSNSRSQDSKSCGIPTFPHTDIGCVRLTGVGPAPIPKLFGIVYSQKTKKVTPFDTVLLEECFAATAKCSVLTHVHDPEDDACYVFSLLILCRGVALHTGWVMTFTRCLVITRMLVRLVSGYPLPRFYPKRKACCYRCQPISATLHR